MERLNVKKLAESKINFKTKILKKKLSNRNHKKNNKKRLVVALVILYAMLFQIRGITQFKKGIESPKQAKSFKTLMIILNNGI